MPSILNSFSILLVSCLMINCKQDQKNPVSGMPTSSTHTMDIHSYSRPAEAVIRHLDLTLTVDFTKKQLTGTAAYSIEVKEGGERIIMDIRDLDVHKVRVDGTETEFTLGDVQEWLGQSLEIPVTTSSRQVEITYTTRPGAEALQWLEPSQTAGKRQPYLFTQGQAILTRTWIPIQDSPGIRLTYNAVIKVPPTLMAVMSAANPQEKNDNGTYSFVMAQPIPAYLIALAIGDLTFKPIGARTGVYGEPSVVDAAAREFSDMENMLTAAEALYGTYRWERYDVIVLPPSFPFGGMENPRLTFATPTIIAGDQSLVSLIAHELAHSWSGNLVTNATWNDFWLNEGFTVYFENRIMEALYGKSYSDMLTSLGHQSLVQTVAELSPRETHLYLDLAGKNPDDGMNDIAYVKGAHFLMMLEEKSGRPVFDAFLKKYFSEHAFQSMSTPAFLEYLDQNLIQPQKLQVNVQEWVHGPGLPENSPVVLSERFAQVDTQVKLFMDGNSASTLTHKDWSTHEWLHFILALPVALSAQQMKDLDHTFGLTTSGNSEIKAAWYKLAIRQGYGREILPAISAFLTEVGRRKFLTPLYSALVDADMKPEAEKIFAHAKSNYHSIAYNTIEALLTKG